MLCGVVYYKETGIERIYSHKMLAEIIVDVARGNNPILRDDNEKLIHREGGPAIIGTFGNGQFVVEFFQNGWEHNTAGPAFFSAPLNVGVHYHWSIGGKRMSFNDWCSQAELYNKSLKQLTIEEQVIEKLNPDEKAIVRETLDAARREYQQLVDE